MPVYTVTEHSPKKELATPRGTTYGEEAERRGFMDLLAW
jgi:hypothetical protein